MLAMDEFQQNANPDTLQPIIARCYEHFNAFDKAVTEVGFNPDVMQHVKGLKQDRRHGLGMRACKVLEFLCTLSSELLYKDTTENRQKKLDNSFLYLNLLCLLLDASFRSTLGYSLCWSVVATSQ